MRLFDASRFSGRSSLSASCLGILLLAALWCGSTSPASAQICDPPGPPPRFGCTWSLDLCDWICPICDPFGPPPRSTCTWDGNLCNWSCPGYTGTDVTVKTKKAPAHDATVYLRMSSLCTATGVGEFCSTSFAVSRTMSLADKCQAIAAAIEADCASVGYAVTVNDCAQESSLTAGNAACPDTAFALGLSNDPGVFDQTVQGPMPDGESEDITGTGKSCPKPASTGNLRLTTTNGGADLLLTWDDTTGADDYLVFADDRPDGPFDVVVGIATSGASGLTLAMAPGNEYYLVAGRNTSCGVGPKH